MLVLNTTVLRRLKNELVKIYCNFWNGFSGGYMFSGHDHQRSSLRISLQSIGHWHRETAVELDFGVVPAGRKTNRLPDSGGFFPGAFEEEHWRSLGQRQGDGGRQFANHIRGQAVGIAGTLFLEGAHLGSRWQCGFVESRRPMAGGVAEAGGLAGQMDLGSSSVGKHQ